MIRGDTFVPATDRTRSPQDTPAASGDVLPTVIWLDEDADGLDAFVPETERRFTALPATPPGAAWVNPPPSPPATNGADAVAGAPAQAPLEWVNQAMRAALLCAVVVAATDWFVLSEPPGPPAVVVDVPSLPTVDATAAVPRAPLSPTPFVRFDATPPVAVAVAPQPVATDPVVARMAPAAPPRSAAFRLSEVAKVADPPPPMAEPTPVAEAATPPPPRAPDPTPPPAPAAAEPARAVAVGVTRVAAVAPPPPRELEARAIDNVLNRYRDAFNTLDARAAVTVWPTVNEKALARAFDSLEGQNVSFDDCRIETSDMLAEVACSGTARYVRKVGNRGSRAEARQWTFSLRKEHGGWLIQRVDSR